MQIMSVTLLGCLLELLWFLIFLVLVLAASHPIVFYLSDKYVFISKLVFILYLHWGA